MSWAVSQKCANAGQKLVLLMLANYCNSHNGQCNPSHKRLAEECSMGVSTLKNHLMALAELGMLEVVPRYMDGVQLPNQYMLKLGGGGQILTDPQPESDLPPSQNLATNQEFKPVIKPIDAPQSDAKKRGSRLADDWVLPKHWGEWALAQFPAWSVQEIRTESDKFRDFWVAKSGKDAAKLDWEATWRNWCRNAKKSSDATHTETPYAKHMRERVSEAAGSFAHIVAAKPPGQTYQQPKAPWEIAIENKRRAAAIGMGGCDLLETVDQVREGLPIEVRGPGPIGGEG